MSASQEHNPLQISEKTETSNHQISNQQLSHLDQLDDLLIVVTPKAWAALICLITLGCIIVLWSIFGSIPINVEGKGIVMNQNGLLINIQAKIGGTLETIFVKPGEFVEKDQMIAKISDTLAELALKRVAEKEADFERDINDYKESQKNKDLGELAKNKRILEVEEQRLKFLEGEVKKNQDLFNQGLVTIGAVQSAKDNLIGKQDYVNLVKGAIEGLRNNIANGFINEELKTKQRVLAQIELDKNALELQFPYYNVLSPARGNILELLLNIGDRVEPGTPIVWMEYASSENVPYRIYGYFDVEQGKRIALGTQVHIALSTINSQEFGFLIGKVKEISKYATSKESLKKLIHNQELVNYLSKEANAVIQVVIEPLIDPETHEYQWTSGKIPPTKITTGTVCTIQAIIERISPFYYLIPS